MRHPFSNATLARPLLTALLFAAALFGTATATAQEDADYAYQRDIPYIDPATPGVTQEQIQRNSLDLYYPKETKGFATVIWYHGGGLVSGRKRMFDGMLRKDVAFVTPNYRLSPQVECRVAIEDCAAAAAWTLNHIAEYGGDPELVFIGGHSAGAYLAAMLVLDPSYLAPYEISPMRFKALLALSSQTMTHNAFRNEQGLPDTQPLIDRYAPLYHVGVKEVPPVLLITGDRELEMPGRYEENTLFERMLKVNGHTDVVLYELQGYDHHMINPGLPVMFRYMKKIIARECAE